MYNKIEDFYLKEIKRDYQVFNTSDFNVNQYYWKVRTRDCFWFYTDTDDEANTIEKVLQTTKISMSKLRMVNDGLLF